MPVMAATVGAPRIRLFCLPYAGGGASAFRSWPAAVPREIEICPVHLPGREGRFREPLQTDAESLAALLHRELMPRVDGIPFALFGHSLGGMLAYELARRLTASGRSPVRLFVSGRRAPGRSRWRETLHALPEREFVAKLREFNGMPEAILGDPQIMDVLLPILRADFQVSETYGHRPGPLLTCPISAMGGTSDPLVGHDDLHAWRDWTAGAFRLRLFPGGHFFFRDAEDDVMKALVEDLFEAAPASA
jgi:medium-chain acyl-[acyl-carrier-protein] hydrolase